MSGYDRARPRPLEIRVLDRREEGGRSEDAAAEQNGVMADAFLLMRVLVEDDRVALSFTALEGWTAEEMSFDALFNLWLAMASKIAQRETSQPDHEKMRQFAERILNLMHLSLKLDNLPGAQAPTASEERVA